MSDVIAEKIYNSMKYGLEDFAESGERYYVKTISKSDLPGDSSLSDSELTYIVNRVSRSHNLELVSVSKSNSTFNPEEYVLAFGKP